MRTWVAASRLFLELDAGPHHHHPPSLSLFLITPSWYGARRKGEGCTRAVSSGVGCGEEKLGSVVEGQFRFPLHRPRRRNRAASLSAPLEMSSSPQLFWRKRSVHEILGGGTVADVMLWRRKDATVGILLGMLAAWIVFEKSGYTLLSLVGSVMLLLVSILFAWAKAAAILGRPPPPIPEFHISEETIKEASKLIQSHVNAILSSWHEITHAKDSKLFYKVAAFLWLISVIGSWTDFLTLGYTSLLIILTVPALYERCEEYVDDYLIMSYRETQRMYDFNTACFKKVREWILEKRKQWILEVEKLR